jgi:hypothetical protein
MTASFQIISNQSFINYINSSSFNDAMSYGLAAQLAASQEGLSSMSE